MGRNVIRGLARAVILAAAVTAHPNPASSQAVANCAQRSEVIEFLLRQYQEKPAGIGLINPHAVMEIYAADSGTWTLVVTDVTGRSCVILAGKSWEALPPQPVPKA
ncbi:hypothetical protein BLJAPNOD_03532 [Ensifer sp. M14]|jgi:hypothetical protein|uniref:hypothetical protein n=1 Tax=Sinorhizobium/Ensifer group TaxID=227292 RepID=UPI000987AEF7|nr:MULTISPECIES: hypothetical protein [Sinorhizobium/Ensifer group]OOG66854.1 hypothetical protein B0E45_23780 [Sinorhizobium sp. A49]RDL52373.1 hypothetical protein BLJAPNOD_03532 [Ensifer sp. M14]